MTITPRALLAALTLVAALTGCAHPAPPASRATPPAPPATASHAAPPRPVAATAAPRPTTARKPVVPRSAPTTSRDRTAPANPAPPAKKVAALKRALADPAVRNNAAARKHGAQKLCAALEAGTLTPFEAAGALTLQGGLDPAEAVALVRDAIASTCPEHALSA